MTLEASSLYPVTKFNKECFQTLASPVLADKGDSHATGMHNSLFESLAQLVPEARAELHAAARLLLSGREDR